MAESAGGSPASGPALLSFPGEKQRRPTRSSCAWVFPCEEAGVGAEVPLTAPRLSGPLGLPSELGGLAPAFSRTAAWGMRTTHLDSNMGRGLT